MHTIHIRSFFLYLLNTMHRNPLFKHSCLQCMCVCAHARKNMLVSQCVTQEGREGRKDGLVSKGTCDSLGGCAHSHQTPQQRVTYILLLLHRKQKRNIIHRIMYPFPIIYTQFDKQSQFSLQLGHMYLGKLFPLHSITV